jgi:hypothetical protein
MGVGGQRHAPAAFTPGKDLVPIIQEAGWAPGPVWIGAENLAPTRIRSLDLPALSESLYRLHYPSPYELLIAILYRVSQEERSIFWEVIVSVILNKKLYMNMCPIPNGFRDRAI